MKTVIGEKTRFFDKEFVFESAEDAQATLEMQNKKMKTIKIMSVVCVASWLLMFLLDAVIKLLDSPIDVSMFALVPLLTMLALGTYLIPSTWKFAGRFYKIVASHFVFLPGKLLFGGVPAFYISLVCWTMPVYGILIAWYQSRCISKAAKEAVASGTYNTETVSVTN